MLGPGRQVGGTHALRARLWKAPQASFTMSEAPSTFLGWRSTFIEKSPHGSPHVHTWPPGMHHHTTALLVLKCSTVTLTSFLERLHWYQLLDLRDLALRMHPGLDECTGQDLIGRRMASWYQCKILCRLSKLSIGAGMMRAKSCLPPLYQ